MRDTINEYFSQFDFDIRKSKDARYVDQKCTPDIVCFLADCVMNIISTKPEFTCKDIWESQYFVENVSAIFNKPRADNMIVRNEYNKVLSQPLKLLAYARILNVSTSNNALTFKVENELILDYISRKDRNAYNFLYCYFAKVLKDSGFMRHMETYRENCLHKSVNARASRAEVYEKYCQFIIGNTHTKSKLDIKRMFHKVFNVYAVEHSIPGSKGKPAYYSDLMYNKANWRDVGKAKPVPRKLARRKNQEPINNYYVQKAIGIIKRIHSNSEVQDYDGKGDATQVHHIFPKSDYPTISAYLENLILLTAQQHNTKAHPKNNTQIINRDYQCVCLLAKSSSIEESLSKGENYYSKKLFIEVLHIGLNATIQENTSFEGIRSSIRSIYNAS